jgi:hypothetical protein
MKPYINSVEVHPQLSQNRHPVDGCAGGCRVFFFQHTLSDPSHGPLVKSQGLAREGSWLNLFVTGLLTQSKLVRLNSQDCVKPKRREGSIHCSSNK